MSALPEEPDGQASGEPIDGPGYGLGDGLGDGLDASELTIADADPRAPGGLFFIGMLRAHLAQDRDALSSFISGADTTYLFAGALSVCTSIICAVDRPQVLMHLARGVSGLHSPSLAPLRRMPGLVEPGLLGSGLGSALTPSGRSVGRVRKQFLESLSEAVENIQTVDSETGVAGRFIVVFDPAEFRRIDMALGLLQATHAILSVYALVHSDADTIEAKRRVYEATLDGLQRHYLTTAVD